MQTHEWAPRVLIANSNLVGDWATWPEFRRLEHLGLTMYGQMTAGSWIYIGTQGILQGTYETFAAVAEKRFGGTLAGTLTLTGGCGGMGGAQPLAVTMNDGACLDRRRRPSRGCAAGSSTATSTRSPTTSTTRSTRRVAAKNERRALVGRRRRQRAPRSSPSCCAAASPIDIVTDQTSPTTRCPTCPRASTSTTGTSTPRRSPRSSPTGRASRWPSTSQAMVEFQDAGAEVFDYGNSIRDEARQGGYDRAFEFPGFVPAYIRPLFCEGKGPFRWAALSGDPKDIAATDQAVLDLFPDNDRLHKWIRGAQERIAFQGLPARICWLGYGERDKAGLAFNDLVAHRRGQRADRDRPRPPRLPARSPAPTARPRRCSTAPTRSPTGRCSTPWSTPRPARPGSRSTTAAASASAARIHAGQVSRRRRHRRSPPQKLERVLTNDPGMGVIRHVDAGYDIAERVAQERGVRIPMREG